MVVCVLVFLVCWTFVQEHWICPHIRWNIPDFMGVSAVQCRYSCSNYIYNAYQSSYKTWVSSNQRTASADSNQWEVSIRSPLVLGVSVLHLTIMSPVSQSWHMSSPVPATLWSLYPPYFSFCVARGTNVSRKEWYFSQSEGSILDVNQWEGEE